MRLSPADRRRHLYVIGQTGTGKSKLILNLLRQDVGGGAGVTLIDPHGDLAEAILPWVPRRRTDDVIVLDPSDRDYVVGINPLFRVPADERALVASNLVATMRHIWRDSWGPRLEYILMHTIRALLDVRTPELRPTLLAIPRLLVDEAYRTRVLREVEDPDTFRFFTAEFSQWNDRFLAEALAPVQNKIGQFLANPFIRNTFGSWQPAIDFSTVLDEGRILIVRVPKGTLGEEPANLFGSVVVSMLFQAAMRRERLPEDERRPHHLYIDEFQNFTTDAFVSILAEARKYALSLTVAHQFVAQVSPQIREAIFGNAGNLLSFRVMGEDADTIAKAIGGYEPRALRELGLGRVCGRVLMGGEPSNPFVGRVPQPEIPTDTGTARNLWMQGRQRYGVRRDDVEKRVRRWLSA